jgi:hypothetical protein
MKKSKHNPGGILCMAGVLALVVVFTACDTPFGGYWEYEFSNQTQYSITVSLDKSYKTSTEQEAETDTDLRVSSKSSQTVYVKSGTLGFEWTSSYSNNNRNVFPEKDGSKVTFKERAE